MTAPYWSDGTCALYLGDSRDVLAGLPDDSVDAVVTDPPYELGFMGKAWDASGIAYNVELWKRCWRVLKPGGHLVAFGGTRTYHRMVCAIEDANFEIRDSMHWIYGSGFPKSLDVGKALDKAAGAVREIVGTKFGQPGYSLADNGRTNSVYGDLHDPVAECAVTAPATDDARRWEGWGTALKPAHEPIVLARKPLGGTVAANVLGHGTGALNIDACRAGDGGQLKWAAPRDMGYHGGSDSGPVAATANALGRWPANIVFTHDDLCIEGEACVYGCPVAELDRQSGNRPGFSSQRDRSTYADRNQVYGRGVGNITPGERQGFNDSGGASRFFPVFRYEAKAPAIERPRLADGTAHSTVKPLALMRWLVRLVTQPGGTVLDPFAGSGTTGEACAIEGFQSLLIEQDPAHAELIKTRLAKPMQAVLGFEVPA